MSMEPYILKIKPEHFNEAESDYDQDKVDIFNSELDVVYMYDSYQMERLSTWVGECLKRKIPDEKQREEFSETLWNSDKVFQVTRDDIQLFKTMINTPWRKSKLYESRRQYYEGYVDDCVFYIKVRLALRAGYVVVIRWI